MTTITSATRTARRWPIRPTLTAAIGVLIAVTVLMTASTHPAPRDAAAARIQPTTVALTTEQRTAWLRQTSTPAGRAHVLEAMKASFGGMIEVGVGDPVKPTATAGQVRHVSFDTSLPIRPEWATGITGDHFWIIASYADINSGAISAAVWACKKRVPGWLCDTAGRLLREWASGWGWATDHGVWAAVYWWPPRVTGGRW